MKSDLFHFIVSIYGHLTIALGQWWHRLLGGITVLGGIHDSAQSTWADGGIVNKDEMYLNRMGFPRKMT